MQLLRHVKSGICNLLGNAYDFFCYLLMFPHTGEHMAVAQPDASVGMCTNMAATPRKASLKD